MNPLYAKARKMNVLSSAYQARMELWNNRRPKAHHHPPSAFRVLRLRQSIGHLLLPGLTAKTYFLAAYWDSVSQAFIEEAL